MSTLTPGDPMRAGRAQGGQVRHSICCRCGTTRTVSSKHWPRGQRTSPGDSADLIADMARELPHVDYWRNREPYVRCLEDLKCSTCGSVTEHAMVFGDGRRDRNEEENGSYATGSPLDVLIVEFVAFGMAVRWRDDLSERLAAGARQYLDDNTWELELNSGLPASMLEVALHRLRDFLQDGNATTRWFVHPADPAKPWTRANRVMFFVGTP